jgi:hypothetical protein
MSRDKGARIEREIVNAHLGLGIKPERVPLSGASPYQGNGSDPDPKAYAACSLAAERPLSKPITAARSWPRERVFMPHSGPCPDAVARFRGACGGHPVRLNRLSGPMGHAISTDGACHI